MITRKYLSANSCVSQISVKKTVLPLLFLSLLTVRADVNPSAILSDHMVLQKAAKVPLWGKAVPGEEISVTLDKQTVKTKADDDGKWSLNLDLKQSEPGPFEMVIEGHNRLVIADVVVGEVWVASGQSNMEFPLSASIGGEKEVTESTNPMLRQFQVTQNASPDPIDECQGVWTSASPQTSSTFTAVGYYFGKKLNAELKVPVGLINASWGGTPSEPWTSSQAIDTVPDLRAAKEKYMVLYLDAQGKKRVFLDWLKTTCREDKPMPDAAAFAAPDISTQGWAAVTLPGYLAAPGLPDSGAVWLRKNVYIPPAAAHVKFSFDFGNLDAFDSVYWNGKRIVQTTAEDYPGAGYIRKSGKYDSVPEASINEGKNTLAIRIYEPVSPAHFPTPLFAGTVSLDGPWLAKTEYALPALEANKIAAAPKFAPAPARLQDIAGSIFNGMIDPLIPYAIRGVIWYQGESNVRRAWQYNTAFPLLITDWRTHWKQGDFPFYFCQLANYSPKMSDPLENDWAELREAQSSALKLPNTGQAVLIDIGESDDIHFRNKKDVGERLARIALAKNYGKTVPFSGPVFVSSTLEKGRISVKFTQADGGLVAKPLPATYDVRSSVGQSAPLVRNSPQSELEGFALCGEDKKWFWADAKIEGNFVIISSDQVPKPLAVRYAWDENPICNLYNGAGLPASPFRTDDFPATTINNKY